MPRLFTLDKILTTKQKKTLRDFYNSENGVSIGNISRIASRMGIVGAEDTYRYLAQLFNDRIISDRREREREQKRVSARRSITRTMFSSITSKTTGTIS
jgi:hypothetical protein